MEDRRPVVINDPAEHRFYREDVEKRILNLSLLPR